MTSKTSASPRPTITCDLRHFLFYCPCVVIYYFKGSFQSPAHQSLSSPTGTRIAVADLPRTAHPSLQVFCTLYAQNKTFIKKVIVGLEYDEIVDKFDDECYKPLVRVLVSNDFEGVHATIENI